MSLSEIARLSGLGKSAAQRFIYTLRALGFLNQDERTRAYTLSPKILEYANAFLESNVVREKAKRWLRQANDQCEETVNLTELDGTEIVYILRYPSKHIVSVDLSVGSRLPAYCTASGRAILAHLPEEKVEAILAASKIKAWTPHTKTTLRDIRAKIQEARACGFALSNQEAFVGDISTAAPVFGLDGEVVAAVNIAVAYPRWSECEVVERLTPLVVQTAQKISQDLGFQE